MRDIGIFAALVAAIGGYQTPAATPQATPAGWSAMTLEHLPLLKRAKMFQWASFSHPSANSNEFYYADPNASGYKVMMDIKGPGCLYNWWSTGEMAGNVGLRVYLDGAATPSITTTVAQLTGQMSGVFGMGWPCVSFVPIPFRSGCVVSTDFPAGQTSTLEWGCEEFFHWYAHTYPTADQVTTYTGAESRSVIEAIWNNVGVDPKSTAGNVTVQGQVAVPGGQAVTIYDRTGQESIASIKIDPTPSDPVTMQSTRIRCYWDGSITPQVDVPLSWFFGSADKGEDTNSHTVPVGISTTGYWYCYFPMPYWTSARIVIQNQGATPLPELRYEIQYKPASVVEYPREKSGYFSAAASLRYDGIHTVLDTTGAGHIVGIVWNGRTGENDEMCWIDDNHVPQFWGTGGEDYPLFCFGMSTASHQMRSGWSDWRWSRYHISDAIPFARSIRFGWESRENHSQGWYTPAGSASGWQSVCFFYFSPEPLLFLTDSLDIGDTQSETAHTYIATGATPTGSTTWEYQGDFNAWGANNQDKLVTDNGRVVSGTSQFTVGIRPDNDGVRLMRRMDQRTIQQARVYVDNVEVTESKFYTPIHCRPGEGFYDTDQLFRDVEFEIPATYTAAKSSITIRIENQRPAAEGGDWTEYYYWVYSYKSIADATTPPAIVAHPQNATVTEGSTSQFSVGATGAQSYQWQENGIALTGQISSILTLPNVQLSRNGSRYRCVAVNAFGNATSNEATLTVSADVQPPTVIAAIAPASTTVVVQFSEPVEQASGSTAANYTASAGVAVSAALVSASDPSLVTLTTSALTSGSSYTVSISNVRDQAAAPNTIAPNSFVTFRYSPFEPGLNISYYEFTSISTLPDFGALSPKKDGTIPNFELSVRDRDNNFAVRYTGFVEIPADGLYTFYTSSDDGSMLYIDGDTVVNNDGGHNAQERQGQSQLISGMHAITVDYFNGCCGMSLAVSWQGPDIVKAPIPGDALWRTSSSAVGNLRPSAQSTGSITTSPEVRLTVTAGRVTVLCRFSSSYRGATVVSVYDTRGRLVELTQPLFGSGAGLRYEIGSPTPAGRYVAVVETNGCRLVAPFVTAR